MLLKSVTSYATEYLKLILLYETYVYVICLSLCHVVKQ